MKKPLMKKVLGGVGVGQLGAGHVCEFLEKKALVAAAMAVMVLRASTGGGTHVLGVGWGLVRGRARLRVVARRSIAFWRLGSAAWR